MDFYLIALFLYNIGTLFQIYQFLNSGPLVVKFIDISRLIYKINTKIFNLFKISNPIFKIPYGIINLEKVENFGADFIDKARNIYKFNDERARIKKLINLEQGSDIVEEKSY